MSYPMRAAEDWTLFEKAWWACLGPPGPPPLPNTLVRCLTCLRTSRADEVMVLKSPDAPRGLAWIRCAHRSCESVAEHPRLVWESRPWTFEDEILARMQPGGAYERDERARMRREQGEGESE